MSALGKSRHVYASLLLASACLGACGADADDGVYALPLAEAKSKISGTQASWKDGSRTRSMRTSPAADGLRVTMPNAGTFVSSCMLQFEAVDELSTRITPDCGDTGAATSDAAARFVEIEIAALVRQTLTGEPVDEQKLGNEMLAVMRSSVGQMSKEGFAVNEEWVQQQQNAAIDRAQKAEDGWGTP